MVLLGTYKWGGGKVGEIPIILTIWRDAVTKWGDYNIIYDKHVHILGGMSPLNYTCGGSFENLGESPSLDRSNTGAMLKPHTCLG